MFGWNISSNHYRSFNFYHLYFLVHCAHKTCSVLVKGIQCLPHLYFLFQNVNQVRPVLAASPVFLSHQFSSVSEDMSNMASTDDIFCSTLMARIAQLVGCQILDWKRASSYLGRNSRRIFLPMLTLCADSYLVCVPLLCYCSGTYKTPAILPKVQVADCTLTHIPFCHSKVGVSWLRPGTVWEPIRETSSHATLQEHTATVISAFWATGGWSWLKEWNWCVLADFHSNKKQQQQQQKVHAGIASWSKTFPPKPCVWGKRHPVVCASCDFCFSRQVRHGQYWLQEFSVCPLCIFFFRM